jgi:thymidylate kinase
MMLIELAGMVGAGKTTVAAELARLLREHDMAALTPQEAAARCLERSWLGRALGPLVKRRTRLQRRIARAIVAWHALAFALGRPRLAWHVLASQRRRTIPWRHRGIIVRLFFQVAGQERWLRRSLRAGEVVVFEEGLVQRAVNLYAWAPERLETTAVAAYFSLLPAADLVVLVRAPFDTCLARARARGMPIRLRDKDGRTIERFMRHAQAIAGLMGPALAAQRRPAITIDNDCSPEVSRAALREHLVTPAPAMGLVPVAAVTDR